MPFIQLHIRCSFRGCHLCFQNGDCRFRFFNRSLTVRHLAFQLLYLLIEFLLRFIRESVLRRLLCIRFVSFGRCGRRSRERNSFLKFIQAVDLLLLQEIVDTAKMFFHCSTTELIYFSRKSVQKITVVADKYHCSVKFADSFFQYIFGTHIQMIGRFVQNQEVHRFQQQLNHSQTSTLSTGKYFHFFIRSLSAKHECTQNVTYLQPNISCRHTVDRIKYRHVFIQHLRLILCKVTDLHVMPDRQFTIKINLAHDTFH